MRPMLIGSIATENRSSLCAGRARFAGRTLDAMPLRPSLLAVLVAVVWGVNFVVIDLGLGDVP